MASLYKRKSSSFWWIKWRDPTTGKQSRISTAIKTGSQRDYIRAVQMRNEHSVRETASRSGARNHPFAGWVDEYLRATHSNSPRTLARYLLTWRTLSTYLATKDISAPAQLDRATCLGYVDWRGGIRHLNSKRPNAKKVGMNTILMDLKLLCKLLNEAVRRGYIVSNSCMRLQLKRDPARVKDEMTDAQVQIIHDKIQQRIRDASTDAEKLNANFLNISFAIARLQGIRLSETHMPLENVDLSRRTLLVRGKGNKLEEVNMNPNLFALFKKLKDSGASHTFAAPKHPASVWFKIFRALRKHHEGFKNISYHSTRVTVITRMERAGVPENVMMKTVLHGSTTVHRTYRRVAPSELADYWKVLGPTPKDQENRPAPESPGVPPKTSTKTPPSS